MILKRVYCRLYGSYENIDGGFISDALVDFTGGISELVDITNKSTVSKQLFQSMMKSMSMQSMIGCSINVSNSHWLIGKTVFFFFDWVRQCVEWKKVNLPEALACL